MPSTISRFTLFLSLLLRHAISSSGSIDLRLLQSHPPAPLPLPLTASSAFTSSDLIIWFHLFRACPSTSLIFRLDLLRPYPLAPSLLNVSSSHLFRLLIPCSTNNHESDETNPFHQHSSHNLPR
nr:hypothetical protein Itr_chr05CG13530 [Ipomoea trifida]